MRFYIISVSLKSQICQLWICSLSALNLRFGSLSFNACVLVAWPFYRAFLGPSTGHCLALLQGISWPFYRALLGPSTGHCLALLQGIAWPFYRAVLGPSTGHCLALLQGIVVWLLLGPSIRHCCLVVAWPFYRAALFGCCLALLQGIVAWPFYRACVLCSLLTSQPMTVTLSFSVEATITD